MVMFVALSMTVPISLDFTLSLNQGATASGFFLSAGVLSGVLAFGVGKKLVDEGNWNQFYVRRLMIIFPLLAVCIDLLMAVFINETATSNESAAIWWTDPAGPGVSLFPWHYCSAGRHFLEQNYHSKAENFVDGADSMLQKSWPDHRSRNLPLNQLGSKPWTSCEPTEYDGLGRDH